MAARVALVALAHDWGMDFCRAVFRAEFGDGRNIGEPAVIADILSALGQNAPAIVEQAQSDANKARLRTETEAAQRAGVFGAPSFIAADGELFWGNDRLEAALAWTRRT